MVWVKRLGIALVALVVLLGIGLAALVTLVDPNDYKPMLQQAVYDRYGRTLAIDGDIRLSVLPRLGLEINGVALSEPDSSQAFAAMDSARIAVAWGPLLSRHLVIEHLSITGLKANLVRNEAGQFNFHDLLASAPEVAADGKPVTAGDADHGPALAWDIAGISIEGGELAMTDAISGTALRLERLTAQARGIAVGQSFDFSLGGRIMGQSPRADAAVQAQARVTVTDGSQVRFSGLDLRLDGVLPSVKASALTLRGNLNLDVADGGVRGENLTLAFQGDVALAPPLQGVDLQVAVRQLHYQWPADLLQVRQATVRAQGRLDGQAVGLQLDAPAVDIGTGQPSQPLELRLQRNGPQSLDANFTLTDLHGTAQELLAGRLEVQGESSLRGGRRVQWHLEGQPRWRSDGGQFTLTAVQGELRVAGGGLPPAGLLMPFVAALDYSLAEAQLVSNGELRQQDQELRWNVRGRGLDGTAQWAVQLRADAFDLERWWPQVAGTATPSAGLATPAAPPASRVEAAGLWDPRWLNDIGLALDVQIGALRARRLQAEQVRLDLEVSEGLAQLKQLQARLYQGTLQASGFATADARLGLHGQVRNVALQPMLQALAGSSGLSGRGNLDFNLSSRGVHEAELRQDLAGTASLQVRDGAIKGINLAQSLRGFRALLQESRDVSQSGEQGLQTDFSQLQACFVIVDGLATIEELQLAAPLLRVSPGEPAVLDLVDETFDVVFKATVVNTSTGQDGKELEDLRGVSIPVHLTGPFAEPSYKILWSQVSGQALRETLQREAERQLGRLLERQGEDARGGALGEALKGLLRR